MRGRWKFVFVLDSGHTARRKAYTAFAGKEGVKLRIKYSKFEDSIYKSLSIYMYTVSRFFLSLPALIIFGLCAPIPDFLLSLLAELDLSE